jgi:CheY-like chemotaxis protein
MKHTPLILIVDDDRDFRELLETKFKASGFSVESAGDGAEGVEKAKKFFPDLILMDVKMPKLDGVGALLKLKEDPVTKDIRVVLLTAFGDPEQEIYTTDKRFAEELGAHEYFLKSQDLDEMVNRVKSSLGNQS